MFDFAWSEIALIGVVALIAIGPKDMPVAIRAISDTIKKLRRLAGEFQGHVDEMLKEADLGDVKTSLDEIRRLNPRAMVQRAIDPDGTVRSAFADPFRDHPVRPVIPAADQAYIMRPAVISPAEAGAAIALPDEAKPEPVQHGEAAPIEAVSSHPADLPKPAEPAEPGRG